MKNRTRDEWRELLKQQANGDLSVAGFCKEHHIDQSYFYKRKSDLSAKKFNILKPDSSKLKLSMAITHQPHQSNYNTNKPV